MDETKLRQAGFWVLLLLAFAPKQSGAAGTVQQAVRLPINIAILWYFGSLILLFTSFWWAGIILHVTWYFIIPRTVKAIRARILT